MSELWLDDGDRKEKREGEGKDIRHCRFDDLNEFREWM